MTTPSGFPSPDRRSSQAAPRRFGVADLQIHTSHGDGMSDAQALLDHAEGCTDLDVIAVTDHDDVRGALLARELHARGHYSFEFVTGIELTTRSGHLLALWVDEPLKPLRSLRDTVADIHRAGGLAVIPHPMSWLTRSIGQRTLERLLRDDDAATRPDGIEVANPSLAGRVTGRKAARLNRERYGLPETGGSDAHFLEEVGTAVTTFRGSTATELRAAIEAGQCGGTIRHQVALREIGIRRLAAQQVRGLSVTPRKVLGPPIRRAGRIAGGTVRR